MTALDPHLDAYQLSSAVDGEADTSVAEHLARCPSCREQVASWARRLSTLRFPVAPAADRPIEAAMAAREPARPRRRFRPSGVPASVVKVAAGVAVAALLASGLVVGLRGHTGGSASTSAASNAPRVPAAAASLGSVRTTAALAAELRARLGSSARVVVPSTAPCVTSAERLDGSAAAGPTLEDGVRFAGKPAEVFVFAESGGYVAWVLATNCSPFTSVRF